MIINGGDMIQNIDQRSHQQAIFAAVAVHQVTDGVILLQQLIAIHAVAQSHLHRGHQPGAADIGYQRDIQQGLSCRWKCGPDLRTCASNPSRSIMSQLARAAARKPGWTIGMAVAVDMCRRRKSPEIPSIKRSDTAKPPSGHSLSQSLGEGNDIRHQAKHFSEANQ